MQKQQHHGGGGAVSTPCLQFMRIFLVISSVLLLIMGISSLAVGSWSLTDDFGADNVEVIMDTDLYTAVAVILIVGGIVVTVTAILGIIGAIFTNKTVLGIYFGIMVAFCFVFVAGAIVTFFFSSDVKKSLGDKMKDTLKNHYEVNTTTNAKNKDITVVWDDIQRKLECCGVTGDLTSSNSWFLWQSSIWFEVEGKGAPNSANHIYVPTSCCNSKYTFDNCQEVNGDNTKPPQLSLSTITTENPALYHNGCLDALEDKIDDHIVGLAAVTILVFLLIIVSAIFAFMVCMEAGTIGKVV